MKVKTSVTLSPEVLAGIDEFAGEMSRSEFIEQVVCRYFREARRAAHYDREVAILNGIASGTIAEPGDVLDYTAPITFEEE